MWEPDICNGPKRGELLAGTQGMPEEIAPYVYSDQSSKALELLYFFEATDRPNQNSSDGFQCMSSTMEIFVGYFNIFQINLLKPPQ